MTASPLHADLYRALTGTDCSCERDRIEDEDRAPRILRITDPDCPEHGTHTEVPDLPPIVADVAAVLSRHRRNHQECSCGDWPLGLDHEEHVALALHTANLIGYQPTIAGLLHLLDQDTEAGR